MDIITFWMNNAGRKALNLVETTELLAKLGRTEEPGARTYLINRICEGNLKLVYTTVKAYSDKRHFRWGGDLSVDLLQVGYLGLRHAVERYDASRGTRLSTVAVSWIRQKIGRHINQKEAQIYIPENLVREIHHVKRTGKPSGTKSTPRNLRLLDMALYAHANPLSLDKPVNKDDERATLGDVIEQPDNGNTGERYASKLDEVQNLMKKAGLSKGVQDFLLAYAECGVKTKAFARAGMKGDPTHTFRYAIERIQSVL